MIVEVETSGTLSALIAAAERVAAEPKVKALILLCANGNGFSKSSLDPFLTSLDLPAVGGLFPNLIHEHSLMEKGSIIWGVARPVEVVTVPDLSDPTNDVFELLDSTLTAGKKSGELQLVFVDGFATRIGEFLSALHDASGYGVERIGGGAGSLDMIQKPCILTNQGVLQDAAVVARLLTKVSVGVAHGWTRIAGPFNITSSELNTIKTLNWSPAFDVYRKVVEPHSGQIFTADNFFEIAKAYPFGIARLDAEKVVRDPLMTSDDGELVCVGEVPEGEYVDILNGDEDSLIAAARTARERADSGFYGEPGIRLFMDCISRVLFLGSSFSKEIELVKTENMPLIGACTFGEIANSSDAYPEFFNKTSVVATLESVG